MKISATYSHLNGLEWMMVHQSAVLDEIQSAIENLDASKYKTKESKERGQVGTMLYSPGEINDAFKTEFEKTEWAESRTSYWVTDDYNLIRRTL